MPPPNQLPIIRTNCVHAAMRTVDMDKNNSSQVYNNKNIKTARQYKHGKEKKAKKELEQVIKSKKWYKDKKNQYRFTQENLK